MKAMPGAAPNPSLTTKEILAGWGSILRGNAPLLSIEITRECPLSCPGCYAYGDDHLGNGLTLRAEASSYDIKGGVGWLF